VLRAGHTCSKWDDSKSKSRNYRGSSEWAELAEFTQGLAGGGGVPRSQFVLEKLALPSIINELAAQVRLLPGYAGPLAFDELCLPVTPVRLMLLQLPHSRCNLVADA